MRKLTRTTAATLLAISLTGCVEESDPTAPRDLRPSRYEGEFGKARTFVSNPGIALVGIQVRGPGIETPLVYQIPLSEGESAFPLSIPEGKEYELAVTGYDRYGVQTFEGKSAIGHVEPGANTPLEVDLFPVTRGEGASVRFDVVGEERTYQDLRITIEADRKEVLAGESVNLRAFGVDESGRRVGLDPARLHWSIEDPRGGRFNFDPRRPTTEQDRLTWTASHIEELRAAKLRVTFELESFILIIPIIANNFVDVSAGSEVTCAVRAFGNLFCWGSNANVMLGVGNTPVPDRCTDQFKSNVMCTDSLMPVGGLLRFSSVSVGTSHVCALQQTTGAAFCWGNNGKGQVGIPTTTVWQNTPIAVSPPAGSAALSFRSISAGAAVTCGMTTTGAEFCWGDGFGSVPTGWHGTAAGSHAGATVTSVSDGFSCRMNSTGVWCDGPPHPGSQSLAFNFLGQGTTAKHVCAIAGSGTTWCWGDNTSGKLGNGTPVNGRTPVNAPSLLTSVAAGRNHSCGLAGTVAFCWGSNVNGELGINTGPGGGSSAPRQVTNGSATPAWSKISAGDRHTCAIDTGGQIWCWGSNYMGQLGINGRFTWNSALGFEAIIAPMRIVD